MKCDRKLCRKANVSLACVFDKSRGCRGNEAKDREWVCRLCGKVEKQGPSKGTARDDELVMPQETNTISDTQPRDIGRVQQDGGMVQLFG